MIGRGEMVGARQCRIIKNGWCGRKLKHTRVPRVLPSPDIGVGAVKGGKEAAPHLQSEGHKKRYTWLPGSTCVVYSVRVVAEGILLVVVVLSGGGNLRGRRRW